MDKPAKPDIDALMADGTEIDKAMRRAVREAVLMHKKLGNPVAEWRDGKVVWLQPDEIVLPEEEAEA
jgi:hypothetical protein